MYCYFWFLYTLHLLLRITKPLLMLRLEQSNHAKKVHIVEVTVAVLVATVPYIVFFVNSDFHISTFPPLYCGAGPTHNFYGVIVPTVVVYCVTLIMMLFVLYKIHIVSSITIILCVVIGGEKGGAMGLQPHLILRVLHRI